MRFFFTELLVALLAFHSGTAQIIQKYQGVTKAISADTYYQELLLTDNGANFVGRVYYITQLTPTGYQYIDPRGTVQAIAQNYKELTTGSGVYYQPIVFDKKVFVLKTTVDSATKAVTAYDIITPVSIEPAQASGSNYIQNANLGTDGMVSFLTNAPISNNIAGVTTIEIDAAFTTTTAPTTSTAVTTSTTQPVTTTTVVTTSTTEAPTTSTSTVVTTTTAVVTTSGATYSTTSGPSTTTGICRQIILEPDRLYSAIILLETIFCTRSE